MVARSDVSQGGAVCSWVCLFFKEQGRSRASVRTEGATSRAAVPAVCLSVLFKTIRREILKPAKTAD